MSPHSPFRSPFFSLISSLFILSVQAAPRTHSPSCPQIPLPSSASRPLANLAIKGESGFDDRTATVLAGNSTSGFNKRLHGHYSALPKHCMLHSFYPDGSSFEDGYSYFTGLRGGSVGLLSHITMAVTSLETLAFAVSFARPPRCMNNGNAANASVTHLAASSSIIPTSLFFDTSSLQLHYLAC